MNRDLMQKAAVSAIEKNKGRGLLVMATGSGKSKVAVMYAKKHIPKKIALIVPTEKLRDNNWKEEFEKWGCGDIWERVTPLCYASANKVADNIYDLVILDEAHNLTPLSNIFFINNTCKDIIGLTATYPRDTVKVGLLKVLRLYEVYTVTLDDSVEHKYVAPYKIEIVKVPLSTSKTIKVLKKDKSGFFMTSEEEKYGYLCNRVENMRLSGTSQQYMLAALGRRHFIASAPSKTEAAKKLIKSVIGNDDRTLIFCGTIAQAKTLCKDTFHSKTNDTALNKFINKEINVLSCVSALNEGINIPAVDKAIITQVDSNDKNFIQRCGRVLRYREGHEAKIYVLCSDSTRDEEWVQKSIQSLDENNIKTRYIHEYKH